MGKNKKISTHSENKDDADFVLEPNIVTCKNCESEHQAEFDFCPHCGQKANENLTVGVLFYNTIANYFSFDARFFKSFIPLMFRPGLLAKRFVSGKRLMYLHPAQMYLFISVLFFFLFSFKVREYNSNFDKQLKKGFDIEKSKDSINLNPIDSSKIAELTKPLKTSKFIHGMTDEDKAELDSIIADATTNKKQKNNIDFGYDTVELDSLIEANAPENEKLKAIGMKDDAGFFTTLFFKQVLKFHNNKGGGIIRAVFDSIPISLFILLPIFALILKVFYWRRGTFAHHLVFSFYYFSFLFALFSLIFGVNYFIDIPYWVISIIIMSTFFYLVAAIKTFYQQGYLISFVKTCAMSFIYMLFVVPIALIIVFGLSFMFY